MINRCVNTLRGKIVEKKYNEEEDTPRLQIPRALTLRHPSGFNIVYLCLQGRCPLGISVSRQLFVWIVMSVSCRQRNRGASHGEVSANCLVRLRGMSEMLSPDCVINERVRQSKASVSRFEKLRKEEEKEIIRGCRQPEQSRCSRSTRRPSRRHWIMDNILRVSPCVPVAVVRLL